MPINAATLNSTSHAAGTVILQRTDHRGQTDWLHFVNPLEIVSTARVDEVIDVLTSVEQAVRHGLFAAGFLTYEASPAFDHALSTRGAGTLPLAWFGLYRKVESLPHAVFDNPAAPELDWQPDIDYPTYRNAVSRIKAYIASGDTYQVNYSWRLRAPWVSEPWALFTRLCQSQRAQYCAYLHLGSHVLCSTSPEVFFHLHGNTLTCKPMKGTIPRGVDSAEDRLHAETLRNSAKNRAENLMIVDMIRNDLGRMAEIGSVRVASLFDVERYPTLWQMTSTVRAESSATLPQIMTALFPCASITGAPKVRTTEIITELESSPRGIYTGAIGYWAPNRDAQFNVAIRTVHLDLAAGRAEYGTGGGIVWDSTPEDEFAECLTKTQVLFTDRAPFRLLETLRWQPGRGYFLLRHHLARLAASADYFGFSIDLLEVRRQLADLARAFSAQRRRVRLLVADTGEITLEAAPLPHRAARRWRVAFAERPVNPADVFLYHKTTRRARYDTARADHPTCEDVLLWNTRGEITESTIANVVIKLDGRWLTPPVACGLLPGTLRAHLLAHDRIEETIITREMLAAAEGVYLINSVRGWIPVTVVTPPCAGHTVPDTPDRAPATLPAALPPG